MRLSDSTFSKLQNIVGKTNCTRNREDLACYAYDATAQTYMPDAVLFPQNAQEISAVVNLANQDGFFVIPRGAVSGKIGRAHV